MSNIFSVSVVQLHYIISLLEQITTFLGIFFVFNAVPFPSFLDLFLHQKLEPNV